MRSLKFREVMERPKNMENPDDYGGVLIVRKREELTRDVNILYR